MSKEKQIEICENCKIADNCIHRILIHMEKCKVNDCDCFQNISIDKEKQIEEKLMELRLDKQELMNEISEKNNKIALLEETIECIKFNVDFTRKETAEKIIDLIKTFCPDKKFVEVITRIISERFGVEIKE